MVLPKPENQPYAVGLMFRVQVIKNKRNYLFAWKTIWRLLMVCVPWWTTLTVPENQPYTVIFRLYRTNNFICMEGNFLRMFVGVRPFKNDTPGTGKSTLCHNIVIALQTKISVCMENCLYPSRPSACVRRSCGSRGWRGLQGGIAHLPKIFLYLVS